MEDIENNQVDGTRGHDDGSGRDAIDEDANQVCCGSDKCGNYSLEEGKLGEFFPYV